MKKDSTKEVKLIKMYTLDVESMAKVIRHWGAKFVQYIQLLRDRTIFSSKNTDQQYEAGHGSEMVDIDQSHAARHVTVPGANKEQPGDFQRFQDASTNTYENREC